MEIKVEFEELTAEFEPEFEEIHVVYSSEIPKEYGLITYNQDKTITIT